MSRLRQKLQDDPKSPRFIKTVWGSGYVFIGQAD
jgi:two-component system phosphate regulon response regulator OmpR